MESNTELGGARQEFPLTTANFRAQLKEASPEARQAVMETLASRYWKPVYHYLRRAYGKGNEDAKDLTQAFFLWLLERDLLLNFEPERSSFRTFLKGVLRNFAGNEHQAIQRLKRGGGVKFVPLEPDSADLQGDIGDPEKLFDRLWIEATVGRAVERVRRRYEAGGRLIPFLAFQQYDLAASEKPPSYAEIAARLGIKESDVRNYLAEVRGRVREEAKSELAATGESDLSVEDWKGRFHP